MDEKIVKEYNKYVETVTPVHNTWLLMAKAFVVGGAICTLGQCFFEINRNLFKLSEMDSAIWCSICLIFISVVLTSLGIYPYITKYGGAGSLVPITGFANAVAASAIEYKKEGQVFGLGAKIFTIAGPVILYGIVSSFILGLIYWLTTFL